MTTSTKLFLGFVAAAFVLGIIGGALGLHLTTPIGGTLLALSSVTIGVVWYRERTRHPPRK